MDSNIKPNFIPIEIINSVKSFATNEKTIKILFLILFSIVLIVVLMNTFSNISILTKASDNENVNSGNTTVYLILNIILLLIVIGFVAFYIYRLVNPRSLTGETNGINPQNVKFGGSVLVGPTTTYADSISTIEIEKFKGLDISNLRPSACKSKTECSTRSPDGRTIQDPRDIPAKCKDAYGSRNLPK
jgi:hypothetical protein